MNQPGFFKTLVAVFGSSVVAGAIAFFIVLFTAMDHRPPAVYAHEQFAQKFKNYYFLTPEDFRLSLIIAGIAAVLVLGLGIAYWISERGSRSFPQEVDVLFKNGFVRFMGVVLTGGAMGAVLFAVMEYVTATVEFPPKWHEIPEFIGGIMILTAGGYLLVSFFLWGFRKMRGGT